MPKNDAQLLYLAAEKGEYNDVNYLLKQGVSFDMLFDGRDALYIASRNGYANIVELLLEAKANPNVHYRDQKLTPLHAAAFYGHTEVVKALLAYNANVNAKDSDN